MQKWKERDIIKLGLGQYIDWVEMPPTVFSGWLLTVWDKDKFQVRGSKANLIKKLSEKKIGNALWATDSHKAPGPDKINAGVQKTLWNTIKGDIVQMFNNFTALMLSLKKSGIFGFGETEETLKYWTNFLGCKVEHGSLKYLGDIIGSNPSKYLYWNPLVVKVKNKLEEWQADHMSVAGRLVLLKATIDSIPSFWFNILSVPNKILVELEKLR
ncbi:uncharacterized protein LOC141665919 [Apium graveolens]|uniref:uncharacterized protein LOC141665919 n=1 Tax=Apium graveolens TaxID=4045 RepID=UPI003D79625F